EDQLDELERQLADIEEQSGGEYVPQILLPTLRDAQRAARRMVKIERVAAELAAAYDEEIEELRRRIEALEQRKQKALRSLERRASWYRAALEQWHRAELERLGGKCLQQNGGETT
ncbi:MAG: hypothetical protein CW346_15205, partial [Bacillaceae bacterium]|nr:hypothetical protein [Bacillaceae bacterium]